jgi:RND family efflux transporter MFP subunit
MKDKNKNMMMGIGGSVLGLLVIVVLISGAVEKTREEKIRDEQIALNTAPRPVEFETVRAENRAVQRNFPGVIQASEESALSFRVGGPLIQVNVAQGEPVKKGDLLMQIDPRDFEDRIQSLEAQLAGAAALQKRAKQDFVRSLELFQEKVVPQSDFDSATSALDAADAAVKNLNVQLVIARHALADTSLRAPYDGTVSAQLVENHEMVAAGQVVLNYHNIQTLEVLVSVPENDIVSRSLNADVSVGVSFPAISGTSCDARLTEWSSAADPLTRTYPVTFQFGAPAGFQVLPGMSADVSWYTSSLQSSVLTVPVSALTSSGDGRTFVWVYHDAESPAESRQVTVGNLIGTSRAIITGGLSKGEQVVVSGSRLIHENQPLKTAEVR